MNHYNEKRALIEAAIQGPVDMDCPELLPILQSALREEYKVKINDERNDRDLKDVDVNVDRKVLRLIFSDSSLDIDWGKCTVKQSRSAPKEFYVSSKTENYYYVILFVENRNQS